MAFTDPMNAMPFWHNGPSPGGFYNFPGNSTTASSCRNASGIQDFAQRLHQPITTTTSVLGVQFDNGVMLAADTLGSYGSLARFRDCPRLVAVNDQIILGSSGDYADYQYLQEIVNQKIVDERCMGDGLQLKPRSLHCWLTRVLYNRRSKFDPLWNNYVVGGIQDGAPFLGTVDKLGTAYEDACVVTGMGAYIATPLLRDAREKGALDQDAARALLEKCLEVLFYRDARSYPRYQIAVVTPDGTKVEEAKEISHDWELAHMIESYDV